MAVFQAVPTLMTGRSLYFKGDLDGEEGAKVHFMNARPADSAIEDYRLPAELASKLKREEIPQHEAARIVLLRHAKQDASYWLGLVCFEQEDYPWRRLLRQAHAGSDPQRPLDAGRPLQPGPHLRGDGQDRRGDRAVRIRHVAAKPRQQAAGTPVA